MGIMVHKYLLNTEFHHSFHLLLHNNNHKLFSCITVNCRKEVMFVGRTKICLLK